MVISLEGLDQLGLYKQEEQETTGATSNQVGEDRQETTGNNRRPHVPETTTCSKGNEQGGNTDRRLVCQRLQVLAKATGKVGDHRETTGDHGRPRCAREHRLQQGQPAGRETTRDHSVSENTDCGKSNQQGGRPQGEHERP